MCTPEVWAVPKDFKFVVDLDTMEAPNQQFVPEGEPKTDGESLDAKLDAIDDAFRKNSGFVSNHPLCKNCGVPARPAYEHFRC